MEVPHSQSVLPETTVMSDIHWSKQRGKVNDYFTTTLQSKYENTSDNGSKKRKGS